jgi:outer membrane lipoprotein SlyB
MRFVFLGFLLGISLSACANRKIDEIPLADAGQIFKTRFGTVVSQHPVTVRSSPQTAISLGIFAAGVTSTLIAADNVTFVGGALAGGTAAAAIHYFGEINDAIEYQIMLEDGSFVLIDQLQASDEPVLQPGSTVVVQFGAMRNRVLPMPAGVQDLPKPRQIRIKGQKHKIKKLDMQICSKNNIGDGTREACVKY